MIFTATVALALTLFQTAAPAPDAARTGTAAPAQLRFAFEHSQLNPSSYILLIHEDGSGHYQSGLASAPAPGNEESVVSAPVDRDIQIHDPLLSTFFHDARAHRFFAITCEAPGSHVAFTGKKTVGYTGPDGHGECTYNWSNDQQLNQLANDLMAVAYTIEVGRRLGVEHLHDRLALDAELEGLQEAVKDHRALEIENISTELQSVANDEAVMNRARNRARALLNGSTPKS
ncbi:MAG TPA: hypothetical protein VHT28_14940 [Silvibacterium sp.]|jgi:hypothetical protein|nr:hypothetical protein [Silvibacterium sp.]